MQEPKQINAKEVGTGTGLRLWIGLLLPPTCGLLELQTLWLTSEYGCNHSRFLWNHVASATFLILSIVGAVLSYGEFRRFQGMSDEDPPAPQRFIAMLGVIGGLLFTAWVFAEWIPTLMGVPCDK